MATGQHMKNFLLIFLVTVWFALAGCANSRPQSTPSPAGAIPAKVIDMRELDGCGFLLELEDGRKLQPVTPLPEKFQSNGMKVLITYKNTDVMSICMSGQPVTILTIDAATKE
jgi:hypothetical protein